MGRGWPPLIERGGLPASLPVFLWFPSVTFLPLFSPSASYGGSLLPPLSVGEAPQALMPCARSLTRGTASWQPVRRLHWRSGCTGGAATLPAASDLYHTSAGSYPGPWRRGRSERCAPPQVVWRGRAASLQALWRSTSQQSLLSMLGTKLRRARCWMQCGAMQPPWTRRRRRRRGRWR